MFSLHTYTHTLNKCPVHNTILLTTVAMVHIQSLGLIHLVGNMCVFCQHLLHLVILILPILGNHPSTNLTFQIELANKIILSWCYFTQHMAFKFILVQPPHIWVPYKRYNHDFKRIPICCDVIYNCQAMEPIQVPVVGWMGVKCLFFNKI